jgi:hypothetical protein
VRPPGRLAAARTATSGSANKGTPRNREDRPEPPRRSPVTACRSQPGSLPGGRGRARTGTSGSPTRARPGR